MLCVIKKVCGILYRAGDELLEHDGIEHAGYLTFLSMLALFPFLVLIVSVAGFIGDGELGTRFINLLFENLPPEAVASLAPRVSEITSGPPQGLLTVSVFGAIWTASGAVEGYRTTLNRAYGVSSPPNYYFRRLMSIGQLLFFTIIILSVMLILVFMPIVINAVETYTGIPIPSEIDSFLNRSVVFLSAAIMFLIIANLYYFLPNLKQSFRSVAPGAAMVALGWIVGTRAFSAYIQNVDQVNIIYGSLGGFIATLLFSFIINVIFIYGAEFNYQLIKLRGDKVEEKEHFEEEPKKS